MAGDYAPFPGAVNSVDSGTAPGGRTADSRDLTGGSRSVPDKGIQVSTNPVDKTVEKPIRSGNEWRILALFQICTFFRQFTITY